METIIICNSVTRCTVYSTYKWIVILIKLRILRRPFCWLEEEKKTVFNQKQLMYK